MDVIFESEAAQRHAFSGSSGTVIIPEDLVHTELNLINKCEMTASY